MKYISDFHIHSHFSLATSRKLVPEYLEYWARIKGINVIGTGDCVHPGWFMELREKLEPCDNGFFRLKEKYRLRESRELDHENIPREIFFMLTGELSSIYKKNERVRKVHNLCVFPDFDSLMKVQTRLDTMGNIRADGRPILGIDSKDILAMVLDSSDHSFLIPAHIWTPWFSVLGSKSGFDTIDECYEDLTPHIFALETGLSSDPPMNRICSFLDRFRLVSNSDAHSPEKLGREANLFDCEFSFKGMYDALKYDNGFVGTVEFFPEEGKYHLDGHRKCGIVWTPEETVSHNGICPVCGREVTKGVLYRVSELSDRESADESPAEKEFYSITQLPDMVSEILGVKNSSSRKVQEEYFRLIKSAGSEFYIFLNAEIDEISRSCGEIYAEGIKRLREGDVSIRSGYDGEFGRIFVFPDGKTVKDESGSLFESVVDQGSSEACADSSGLEKSASSVERSSVKSFVKSMIKNGAVKKESGRTEISLNEKQRLAVQCSGNVMVMAGPGAGKTRVLVEKILFSDYVSKGEIEIAAVTFSIRAAREMEERLSVYSVRSSVSVSTFHSLGLKVLEENVLLTGRCDGFRIADRDEIVRLIKKEKLHDPKTLQKELSRISDYKQGLTDVLVDFYAVYEEFLVSNNIFDIDDLVYLPVKLLHGESGVREKWKGRFGYILVDEFQDINAIQYMFLKLLYDKSKTSVFIIGDRNQAIYGFRGSDVKFIDRFREDFSPVSEIALDESYRCPDTVLSAASSVVRSEHELRGMVKGEPVFAGRFGFHTDEADFIASEIERILGGVRSFSIDSGLSDGMESALSPGNIAVICRTSLLFSAIASSLEQHGIPFQITGSADEVLAMNLRKAVAEIAAVIPEGDSDLVHILDSGQGLAYTFMAVMEYLDLEYDENHLCQMLGRYSSIEEVLKFESLSSPEDDYSPGLDAVSLMTIHASKGLEFDTVFIPGFENGIVPFSMFGEYDDLEERRIAYVAMTRAKRKVYLTSSESRILKGRKMKNMQSSYAGDIPENLLDSQNRKKEEDRQLKLF